MPVDEKTLVVSFAGNDPEPPPKVRSVVGEYVKTEPGCFRKEGGGKINFLGGYWYIVDRLGQQVAWVEGGAKTIPETNWQTRGDGIFGSWEDIQVSVTAKIIKEPEGALAKANVGCAEAWGQCWVNLKDKIPHEHRQTVEGYEARLSVHRESFKEKAGEHYDSATGLHDKHMPELKRQASQHLGTAKEKFEEYSPVVKAKAKEAATACHEWWTHPDTVDALAKMKETSFDAAKFCIAGILAMAAGAVDQAMGNTDKDKAKEKVEVTDNDQAMDASYVKVDSTTPVLVEKPAAGEASI